MEYRPRKNLNTVILLISAVTLFVFVISFSIFYTQERFSGVCGCSLPIWVIITAIASFGVFTGTFIFYILNKNYFSERKDITNSIFKTLNFLENDEKKVFKFLINNSGESFQSNISKALEIDKVKLSRVINNLEQKGIIKKEKKGVSNMITISNGLKKLFISE